MRNVVAIIVFFLLQNLGAFAAKGRIAYPGGKFYIYRLSLTDKKGSPGTLDHPEKYLSQKALLRRERQHISVDSLDLPLSAVYLNGLRNEGAQVIGGSKWNNTVLVRTKTPLSWPVCAPYPTSKVPFVYSRLPTPRP